MGVRGLACRSPFAWGMGAALAHLAAPGARTCSQHDRTFAYARINWRGCSLMKWSRAELVNVGPDPCLTSHCRLASLRRLASLASPVRSPRVCVWHGPHGRLARRTADRSRRGRAPHLDPYSGVHGASALIGAWRFDPCPIGAKNSEALRRGAAGQCRPAGGGPSHLSAGGKVSNHKPS